VISTRSAGGLLSEQAAGSA